VDEVRPLETLRDLGYVTVGMQIDRSDWRLPGRDEIVRRSLQSAERGEGTYCCSMTPAVTARRRSRCCRR
jgi:hypothetical protein